MPFIITDFVDFKNGYADCPACIAFHGKKAGNKKLSLFRGTDGAYSGAYKCHRGCTPAEIREALNYRPEKPAPSDSNNTPKPQPATTPEAEILTAAKSLEEGKFAAVEARAWLDNRGITSEIRQHFKLGISRRRCQGDMKYAIDVPLPDGSGNYYRKSRIAPWEGEKGWSQYGIPQHVFWAHKPEGFTTIYLCGGEWDAMLLGWQLRSQNDIAVATFTCGETSVPPIDRLQELTGKNIYIFYDLDEAGRSGAKKVATATGAKICELPSPDPAPKGWDISDFLNAGYPIELLHQAAESAKESEAIAPEEKKPKSLRDRLITNDQLMSRAPDLIEYLVPDLLTSNELFVLATAPRGGKSLMAMALAHGVATGGKFLGRPCTQGSVIYVNLEDSDAKIKDREIQQGWGEGLPIYWLDKFKLSELPELIDVAKDLNPRLIVLDTLSRIKDGATSEASAEMSQVLEPLQEFAKQHDCAVLLVHHTKKIQEQQSGQVEVFDTIRGSSAIRATARGAWILVAGERSHRLVVEHGHGRFDLEIYLNLATLTWTELGKWKPNANADQADLVLAYLEQHGEGTAVEIADAMNIPKKSCQVVLWRLQLDDLIGKRSGTGRKPAVYFRSANKLTQINSLLTLENSDPVSDTGLRQQKNQFFSPENQIKQINLTDSELNSPDLISDPKKIVPVVNTSSKEGQSPTPQAIPCDNFVLTSVNTESSTQSKVQKIDQADQLDHPDPLPDRVDQITPKIDQTDQVTGTRSYEGDKIRTADGQEVRIGLIEGDRAYGTTDAGERVEVSLDGSELVGQTKTALMPPSTHKPEKKEADPIVVQAMVDVFVALHEAGELTKEELQNFNDELSASDRRSIYEACPPEVKEQIDRLMGRTNILFEPGDIVNYTGKQKRLLMQTSPWIVKNCAKNGSMVVAPESTPNSTFILTVKDIPQLALIRPRPLKIQEIEVGGEYSCPSLNQSKVKVVKIFKSVNNVLIQLPYPHIDREKVSVSWLCRLF